jgi:hypothetical protein
VLADQVDENGDRVVVRDGHARPRTITTAAGRIDICAPRVNDQRVDPRPVSGSSSRTRSWRRGAAAAIVGLHEVI